VAGDSFIVQVHIELIVTFLLLLIAMLHLHFLVAISAAVSFSGIVDSPNQFSHLGRDPS
jgi:hypothetical protein